MLAYLQTLDPTLPVILQCDSEGNGFSPMSGADATCAYHPDSTWSGEVKPMRDPNKVPADDEDDDEYADKTYTPCVVLYPIN